MKALSFNRTGTPEDVLELVEKEIPTPNDDEVLIKVLGSPIHPADYLFIQGAYRYQPEFPDQTAGLEGAGIIESVGTNVALQKGSLVAFDARGAWSEYVLATGDAIVPLPDHFPTDKAVQFYLNPFTAWGLLEKSKAKRGEWLLLTAANSAVSGLVIQLAKRRGINVIAAVRNEKQADALKRIGADEVIHTNALFSAQIEAITSGKGIDAALDAVGGEMGTNILQNMAAGGRIIIYGLLSKDPVQLFNAQVIFKNLLIQGFGIRGFVQNQTEAQKKEMINTLISEMAKPSFELPVAEAFPMSQFKEALAANGQPGKKGKIILTGA